MELFISKKHWSVFQKKKKKPENKTWPFTKPANLYRIPDQASIFCPDAGVGVLVPLAKVLKLTPGLSLKPQHLGFECLLAD